MKKAFFLITFFLTINIHSVNAEELRDVSPPFALPMNPVIFWIMLFLLLGGLILGVLYVISKRLERRKITVGKIKTPYECAMLRLKSLQEEDLLNNKRYEEFYLKLSRIIRYYFEEQFTINAPDMTTEEFLADLQALDKLNEKQKNVLKDFLTSCDLVKFAKHEPGREEVEKSFELAKALLEETRVV